MCLMQKLAAKEIKLELSLAAGEKIRDAKDLPSVPLTASTGCGDLSQQLLRQWARNNTVMITFTDHLMFNLFGTTWRHNVEKAGIDYWVLSAADNRTAELLRVKGVDHCFMAEDMEVRRGGGMRNSRSRVDYRIRGLRRL